jgi:dTDP-4-dehydrorhamnose reductase
LILVTGASGQLGAAFSRRLGEDAEYVDHSSLDLSEPGAADQTIRRIRPSAVINCAAYTAVDRAETEEAIAFAVNAAAVEEMAVTCRDIGANFVTYSTDYVFDGTKPGPYVESDATSPINAYGRTKYAGEQLAFAANPDSLVIRTSWVMSGTHRNFASVMLELIAKGDVTVVADQLGRPTFVDDLVTGTMSALDIGATGILHMANAGSATWYELARMIADIAGLDPERVMACTTAEYPTEAARPLNSVLDSERIAELEIAPLPDFQGSLEAAVNQLRSSQG